MVMERLLAKLHAVRKKDEDLIAKLDADSKAWREEADADRQAWREEIEKHGERRWQP